FRLGNFGLGFDNFRFRFRRRFSSPFLSLLFLFLFPFSLASFPCFSSALFFLVLFELFLLSLRFGGGLCFCLRFCFETIAFFLFILFFRSFFRVFLFLQLLELGKDVWRRDWLRSRRSVFFLFLFVVVVVVVLVVVLVFAVAFILKCFG